MGVLEKSKPGNLDYRGPGLLMDALSGALPPPAAALDVLDAGCGTGLCGPLLRPFARNLTGVDLAPAMLARAAGCKAYDHLIIAELTAYLNGRPEAYDVIVSADTLCYFGALEPVFQAAARALRPGGHFAFTLEDAGSESSGWQLNLHGRYAHTRSYVEAALDTAGLAVHSILPVVLRSEGKHPVKGHVVVAVKDEDKAIGAHLESTERSHSFY